MSEMKIYEYLEEKYTSWEICKARNRIKFEFASEYYLTGICNIRKYFYEY